MSDLGNETFDFTILNHVIEHVANPIAVIGELFRVTRIGGRVIIGAPDKDYTFDKPRHVTPYSHLLEEFEQGTTEVTDEHYLDFLRAVHPEMLGGDAAMTRRSLDQVRSRREHAHVWTSAGFREFLEASFETLEIRAVCEYESMGAQNRFEHFSVWKKLPGPRHGRPGATPSNHEPL